MATHLSRKELKQDAFTVGVEGSVDYFTKHRTNIIRYGGAALVVIAIAAGVWYYMKQQAEVRQQALGEAMTTFTATVGSTPQPGVPNFPTEQAKTAAVKNAFTKIEKDYAGSTEAYIAEYYLAGQAVDAGLMDDARRQYQDVADHAETNYASLAKYALAQVDEATGRPADAEKILKDLMDHPTDLVSKNQATIAYAKAIGAKNPTEARNLLTEIIKDSDGGSQAVAALSEISAPPAK